MWAHAHVHASFLHKCNSFTHRSTLSSYYLISTGDCSTSVYVHLPLFLKLHMDRPWTYYKLFNLLKDVCFRFLLFTQGCAKTPYVCHFKKRLLGQRACACRCQAEHTSHQWCGSPIPPHPQVSNTGRSGSSQHTSYPKIIPLQVSSSFSSRAVCQAFTQHSVPSPSLDSQKSR